MEEESVGDLTDVSNSAALVHLNNLVNDGAITEAKTAILRSKYEKLNEAVLRNYEQETQLMQKGRRLKGELGALEEKINRTETSTREDSATIESLRADKAKADTAVLDAQEQLSLEEIEQTELEQQLQQIEMRIQEEERDRMEAIRPQLERLEALVSDLRLEIGRLTDQERKLTTERVDMMEKLKEMQEGYGNDKEMLKKAQSEHKRIEHDPAKAMRQVTVVSKASEGLKSDLEEVELRISEYEKRREEQEKQKKSMEDEWYELTIALENQRTAIEQKERVLDGQEKNLESGKEVKMAMVTEQLDLELRENTLSSELVREREYVSRFGKEKEQKIKSLRRTEKGVQEAKKETIDIKGDIELKRRDLSVIESECKSQGLMLEELKKEVDILINNFLREEGMEKETLIQYEKVKGELDEMEEELLSLRDEEKELEKEVAVLTVGRERASRDSSRAKTKLRESLDFIRVRNADLKELLRREEDVEQQVKVVERIYSKLKKERNKYAMMIQTQGQKVAEIKEKNRILENELDVLRRRSVQKDQELGKERRDYNEKFLLRENLRSEVNKLLHLYRQKKEKIDEQLALIDRLNGIINNAEDEMLRLKKGYERLVDDRNFTGIQLIDRNDELCILYEKSNIQESVITEGEIELRKRQDEIRFLSLELSDLTREIEVSKRLLPRVEEMREEILDLQNQVFLEKALEEYLSKVLETPSNEQRWRRLGGKDEPVEKLSVKMMSLEERLNDEKEQLLEKNLVLEEITGFSDSLRHQAVETRETALSVAKSINFSKADLRKKDREIKAAVSELSVYQAQAMKLQQEKDEWEQKVQEAMDRLDSGEPPTPRAEDEFYREEHRVLIQEEAQRRMREQSEALITIPATITRTTCEPRPNAYFPEGGVAIPKPYGGMAPFKPTETGGSMRHFRKPQPSEIEI